MFHSAIRVAYDVLRNFLRNRQIDVVAKAAANKYYLDTGSDKLISFENIVYIDKALQFLNTRSMPAAKSSRRRYWPPRSVKTDQLLSKIPVLKVDMASFDSLSSLPDDSCIADVENERYDSDMIGSWSLFEAGLSEKGYLTTEAFTNVGRMTLDPCGTIACGISGLRGLDWCSSPGNNIEMNIARYYRRGSPSVQYVYRGGMFGGRVIGGTILRCSDDIRVEKREDDVSALPFIGDSNGSRGLLETAGTFLMIRT